MGKLDIESKIFFQNKERFADLFNFKLYGGRQQIRPEDLKPFDSAEVIAPYGDKTGQPIQRFRDNVSIWASMQDDHSAYIILGIESQANIHYAMPVRNMLYDSVNYAWQVRQAAASYRNNRTHDQNKDKQQNNIKLNSAEFLSGFRKEDRLMPVITVVVLLNADEWDGPRSIHEMLSIHDRTLLHYIPDYHINLVAPADLLEGEYHKFHTSLGPVLEYIRVSRDKKKLDELLQKDPRYSRMERESADLINTATNSELTYSEEGDQIDMCKAIEDMRADARTEGKAEGKAEANVTAIKNVVDSIHVSIEEAMDILKIDPDKRQEYAAMVK